MKWANLWIIGIPKGEEKEKGIENIFEEIVAENFPNLKETDIKIQEAQKAPPQKLNPNRPTPRHIIIKTAKFKGQDSEGRGEKERVNYKGTPIRLSADFSTGRKRVWQEESVKIYSKWKREKIAT